MQTTEQEALAGAVTMYAVRLKMQDPTSWDEARRVLSMMVPAHIYHRLEGWMVRYWA